ncbi:MAG TPA: arylamine N-acetyltransferase [Phenylobacterium sp.]|nr:arylamine N-acetyltransferase [Phenylobacterium sp.]
MDLQAYFNRIGFTGETRPDAETLRALHRAHLLAIPYDSLDVQLGNPVSLDPQAAFEKIVVRGRGGWCYEMNGLFGAVLQAIGFQVTRMAGAAMREQRGDFMNASHLVLLVESDDLRGLWIADVGFGDGALEPFPLVEGPLSIEGYDFRLEKLDDRWWRFHNHEFGGAKSFDFVIEPADQAVLQEKCDWLHDDPNSPFVQNLICQRYRGAEILQLLGRSLRQIEGGVRRERLIASAEDLVEVLARDFTLDVPEVADLWPRVVARHEQVMAEAAAKAEA